MIFNGIDYKSAVFYIHRKHEQFIDFSEYLFRNLEIVSVHLDTEKVLLVVISDQNLTSEQKNLLPHILWIEIGLQKDTNPNYDKFFQQYHHYSLNTTEYECFCIYRFFLMYHYMNELGIEKGIYCDSDLVLFHSPQEDFFDNLNQYDLVLMTPYSSFLSGWTLSSLGQFLNFITQFYNTISEEERSIVVKDFETTGYFSSMSLLQAFLSISPQKRSEQELRSCPINPFNGFKPSFSNQEYTFFESKEKKSLKIHFLADFGFYDPFIPKQSISIAYLTNIASLLEIAPLKYGTLAFCLKTALSNLEWQNSQKRTDEILRILEVSKPKVVHFWGPFKYLIQELWEKKYHSHAQLKQDLEVLKHYGFKRNGYFVDVGANDGILLSNTFLLENGYGWHGICIEPIPNIFNELVFRRPGSHYVQKACYNKNNQRMVFSVTKDNLFSGITNSINCHKFALEGSQEIIVDTITLETVLMENNAPLFIEYLSLDTEGSELEILHSMDWDKYSFGIIHVEHNFIEPQRTQIREFLESKQYVFIRENRWDDVFHHPTLSKKNDNK